MRALKVLGIVVSMGLATLPAAAPAATSATEKFIVVSNGERIGWLNAHRADDRVDIDFRIDENGRGPKIKESIRLGPTGVPVEWKISGTGYVGAPVREEFTLRGGKARWSSLNDSGNAAADDATLYIANEASPWSYGVFLRTLLARPGQAMKALPGGELRAEKIRDIPVGSGAAAQTVGAYAMWGLDTQPQLVLATAAGELFGLIDAGFVLLPEAHESQARALSDLAASLHNDYLEQLTRRFVQRYEQPVYLRNVRVFDSHKAQLGAPTTVVVFRDRIASIRADAQPPAGAVIIDGEGGTLLPGLFDLHVHLSGWALPLHLAAGVTSVRDVGNDNDVLLDLVSRTRAGSVMGPRVTLSGFIEGRSQFSARGGFVIDQLQVGLEKVRWYADHGYSAIKIYNSMTPDWVAPLAAEAHRLGMRVSGHVPAFMTSERAVRDGYDEINHVNQLMLSFVISEKDDTRTPFRFTALGERIAGLDLDSEPVQRMVRLMKERGTTLDPTMTVFEWLLLSEPGKTSPGIDSWLSHMPVPMQRGRRVATLDVKPAQRAQYRASWEKLQSMLKLLHDQGIRIVPGTDNTPGFVLHSELEIYAKAGIPNERVLQIATLEPARYLGVDQQVGSIEPGKLADLLLVAGDPTRDMSAIRQVRMVVKNGEVLFPEDVYSAMSIEPFGRKPKVAQTTAASPASDDSTTSTSRGALH